MTVTDYKEFTIRKVEWPKLKIVDLKYPDSARPGESVSISWKVCNYGGDSGVRQWFRIKDLDTGEVIRSVDLYLSSNECKSDTWTFTMPSRDWRLRAEAGYGEATTATRELTISSAIVPPTPPTPYIVLGGIAMGLMTLSAIATYAHEKGWWKR